MKRDKQLNGSAAEVEAAFYDALNRADLDALMALWADDEEVLCVHPGGPRLIGHAAIEASWKAVLARGGLHILPSQLHATHTLMSSVHTLIEGATASGGASGQEPAHLVATNVYVKTPVGWRIVVHHVSVAAGPVPADTRAHLLH